MAYKKRSKSKYGKRYKSKYRKFRSRRRGGMLFNRRTNVVRNKPFVIGDKRVVGLSDKFYWNIACPSGTVTFCATEFLLNDVNDPQNTGGSSLPVAGATALFEFFENCYTKATEAQVVFISKDGTYAPLEFAIWASVDGDTPTTWEYCQEYCKQANGRSGAFSVYQKGYGSIKVYPGALAKLDWKDADACAHVGGLRVATDKQVYLHVAVRNHHASSTVNVIVGITLNMVNLFYGARHIPG